MWLNKYVFEGNNLKTPDGKTIKYNTADISLSLKELDRRSNLIQEKFKNIKMVTKMLYLNWLILI